MSTSEAGRAPGQRGRGGGPVPTLARVCAGELDITYAQAGVGRTIVLLDTVEPATEDLLLFDTLSRYFRVVAPVLEPGGHAFMDHDDGGSGALAVFLRSFLDGLGLLPVRLVASGPFTAPVLIPSLLDPERVERVALVFRHLSDPPVAEGAMLRATSATEPRMFVVHVDGTRPGMPSQVVAALTRFLASGAGDPTEDRFS